jgi:hypothetical protein
MCITIAIITLPDVFESLKDKDFPERYQSHGLYLHTSSSSWPYNRIWVLVFCARPFQAFLSLTIWHMHNDWQTDCTLLQALKLCAGRTAHRGNRGTALSLLDHGTEGGEGSASRPSHSLSPGKHSVPIVQEAGWASGLVCTGAENLVLTRIRSLERPARSESLYRLRYPVETCVIGSVYLGTEVHKQAKECNLIRNSGCTYTVQYLISGMGYCHNAAV